VNDQIKLPARKKVYIIRNSPNCNFISTDKPKHYNSRLKKGMRNRGGISQKK